ncbi:DUF5686 family protein [Thermaurantimonas aggregans]|uniref:DUF5686 family protein n=1 Tax=Thermaurantimonas aggregans TaxID=2173829 RepID=UPI000F560DF5|nr:DUF5686 family protein [Thermaurantimonas aggregans]MCX8147943.1 DUF5686 family protein [Thermaurantimonas aggregans]
MARLLYLFIGLIAYLSSIAQTHNQVDEEPANKVLFRTLNNANEFDKKISKIDLHFTKSSEIFIDNYPSKIPFLGGVLLPNISDTGLVYVRLAEGIIKHDKSLHREFIYKLSEYGKVHDYPIISVSQYLLNPYDRYVQIPTIEANFYLLPFQWKNFRSYQYSFEGKIKSDSGIFYQYFFYPKNRFGSFFSGTVLIDSATSQIAKLQLKAESNNKLNLADSLLIEIHCKKIKDIYFPFYYLYTFHYSIQQYTGRHVIQVYAEKLAEHFEHKFQKFTKIEIQDTADFLEIELTPKQRIIREEDITYYLKKEQGFIQDSLFKYAVKHPFKTILTSGLNLPIRGGKNLVLVQPFWRGFGFNAVESFYMRLGASISSTDLSKFTYGVEVRPSITMDYLRWKQSLAWNFLHQYNGKGEITFGNTIFQINENDPILPIINSFYSLFLNENYASYYEKSFLKGVFSISIQSFDIRLLAEYSHRSSLNNALDRSPFWKSGAFLPNNPDHPPAITANGFANHYGMTLDVDISWQPGRYYLDVNRRKTPLKSESPTYFLNYRKGIKALNSQVDFDQITLGLQLKRRISRYGVSTLDVQYGRFVRKSNVPFVDFKHFNGIQTLFLQPTTDRWSDIRQFRTLRYYDFSTDEYFFELHYIHRFGGALFNNWKSFSRLNIHTVAGLNLLSTETENIYFEPFLGFENLFKIFKIQLAYGMENWQKSRVTLRLGFNFNIGIYKKYRRI